MKQVNKKLVIIGLGYVGLPLALLAANRGYDVVGIDIDKEKVKSIKSRKSPFADSAIDRMLKTTKMDVSTDVSRVKDADIIVICVPTPVYENRLPNYEPVEGACRSVGEYLKKGQLVILESTVNPGVCEELVIPVLEVYSGLSVGEFSIAHCPERINPGDKKWNVSNIPRVVGGYDKESLDKAVDFYKSIISAEIRPMKTLKEAEAVKVVENSFRNINIAFVNELAIAFDKLGIDVVNVIDGAATKPFSFMAHYPGCGIGGHCIPVDPYYLIDYSERTSGFSHTFLKLACQINEEMPKNTVDFADMGLNTFGKSLNDSKVAVLGLSYKADIDDCRESPSYAIISDLEDRGAKVVVYDPHVKSLAQFESLRDALDGVDAVILATSHKEFGGLKSDDFSGTNVRVVIDGRNCLNKEDFDGSGIYYKGIGR